MIIDTHAHMVPRSLFEAVKSAARDFPSVAMEAAGASYQFAFSGGKPTRPVFPKLLDPEQRIAWMNGNGITHQIIGGWLDLFGYELPGAEGLRWSRLFNEHLLAETKKVDGFVPLASVPLQDGALAAEVLNEALDAGFPGVMIGTQPKGIGGTLDDPTLDPFWEVASKRGAVVYIHPMYVCGDDRLADYDLVNAVGRGTDTTVAVARLLFAGHVTKYSGAKIVISHGGGALPYLLGRLVRHHANNRDKIADPMPGMTGMYYDTVLLDPAALRFMVEKVGAGRVMLGSDYPFPIGDPEPCKVVHGSGFSEIDLKSILGETAAKLFQVSGCGCGG